MDLRCRVCDAQLSETARFFPNCGRELDDGGSASLIEGAQELPQKARRAGTTPISTNRKTLIGISLVITLLSSAFSVAAIGNAGALGDTVIIMSQDDAFVIFFASIAAAVMSLVSIIAILLASKDR